jgi:hypothetical protein
MPGIPLLLDSLVVVERERKEKRKVKRRTER